jgi:hypothetical protein
MGFTLKSPRTTLNIQLGKKKISIQLLFVEPRRIKKPIKKTVAEWISLFRPSLTNTLLDFNLSAR